MDFGDRLLMFKADPITVATEEIGWDLVQVKADQSDEPPPAQTR